MFRSCNSADPLETVDWVELHDIFHCICAKPMTGPWEKWTPSSMWLYNTYKLQKLTHELPSNVQSLLYNANVIYLAKKTFKTKTSILKVIENPRKRQSSSC